MSVIRILPSKLKGNINLPPSKSMAHRLLICAGLAEGTSQVKGLDYSADIKATINALEILGAKIECCGNTATVQGIEKEGFYSKKADVNCNESGTTLRLFVPIFSLSGKEIRFTGAKRLYERPLTIYKKIFTEQGLGFKTSEDSLEISGAIKAGEYSLPGNVSSQFLSGLLLALPLLDSDSRIAITTKLESRSYIELTREAQNLYGVNSIWEDENHLFIPGGQKYYCAKNRVEGDWSQAAVPAVLAACAFPEIEILGLSESSTQGDKAILKILESCGAKISWKKDVLRVSAMSGLVSPGDINIADCPDLGPILCTLALFCSGETRIINAKRLRIKECDRIAAMESGLLKMGANISSTEDCITIKGETKLNGGQMLQGHNDHRIVMALCSASLIAGVENKIDDAQSVAKSWPEFFVDMAKLGVGWIDI